MNKSEPINIALASDQTYYVGLWVTLVSLLSNTNTKSDINFFIFDGGINKKSKKKLLYKLKKINANITISWLDPQIHLYQNFLSMNSVSSKLTYSIIIIPEKLDYLDKVIWLDADLIVLRDIESFWNTEMDGNPIAAVIDYGIENFESDIKNYKKYSIDLNSHYYNTGVMLMDIKLLKKHDFTKKCLDYLRDEDKNNYRLHDQSAINVVMNKNFKTVDKNFNVLDHLIYARCNRSLKPEMNLLLNNRYIFHNTFIKHWKHYQPTFHCELFYFFLKKYNFHNKSTVYFKPLKFKFKTYVKKIVILINYKGFADKFFNMNVWFKQIERFNFIRKNRKNIIKIFDDLS